MQNKKLKTIIAGAISVSLILNSVALNVSAEEVLNNNNQAVVEEINEEEKSEEKVEEQVEVNGDLTLPDTNGDVTSPNTDIDQEEIDTPGEEEKSEVLEGQVVNTETKELISNIDEVATKEINDEELVFYVSNNLVSMTDEREIEVIVSFDKEVKVENLKWYFGDKEFNQWKTWNNDTKDYTGSDYIEFVKEPEIEGNKVKATIKFNLLFGSENASSYRSYFPALIGNYDLKVVDTASQEEKTTEMKLNIYDTYRTYDELKPELDEIFKNASDEIYLEYEVIGQSVEGRDMHTVIMAKSKEDVDNYLNKIRPLMDDNPAKLQEMLKNGDLEGYKVPMFINNIHANETPGVDAQLEVLKKITTKESIDYKVAIENKTVNGGLEDATLNIETLLDNVILIMNLTENPDGRYYNVRANVNGFDLNRDNGYQTQKETRIVVEEIAKWNPISFLELHGFIKGFLIEPCTPPHDPNYEYDILIDSMVDQANIFGRSAIANSKFESYFIPYEDDKSGWDDGGPAYTPVFAMHHGTLGHTIEIPELNQESVDALEYGLYGAMNYICENKDKLFYNQLEYYNRGVNGIDAKEQVDKFFINGNEEVVGRPRGENENFFPEYYVLPVDSNLQKNVLEVYNMVEHLLRNGVKVGQTTEDVLVDGINYPKGSYVVDMHQAKRGLANMLLYDGYDVSDFDEMYAELVINFPALRGFDEYEIRQAGAFESKYLKIDNISKPVTAFADGDEVIVQNASTDTIKAINKLLANGEEVEVILNSGEEFSKGDFLVEANDLKNLCSEYYLELEEASDDIISEEIVQPKVANIGSQQSSWILTDLGFNLVTVEEADIVIDDNGKVTADILNSDKNYIGVGMRALAAVANSGVMPEFEYTTTDKYGYHEGLVKGVFNLDSVITSGYDKEDYIYTANGAWISSVPESATIIAEISSEDDFFVGGWWPGYQDAKGEVMALTDEVNGKEVTLFAGTLMNKAHTQAQYRLISNTVFASVYDEKKDVTPPEITVESVMDGQTYKEAVLPKITSEEGAELTIKLNGVTWDGKAIEKSGDYTLEIIAIDAAGNKSEVIITFKVEIDEKDKEEDKDNGADKDKDKDNGSDKDKDKNNNSTGNKGNGSNKLPYTGGTNSSILVILGAISALGGGYLTLYKKKDKENK